VRHPDRLCPFGTAQADAAGALHAIKDNANMPLQSEPHVVRDDLARRQAH
jgi:hypothetical protein